MVVLKLVLLRPPFHFNVLSESQTFAALVSWLSTM